MNLTILLLVSIFSSFTVTANPGSIEEVLKEMQEKLRGVDERMMTSEKQVLELMNKGNTRVIFSAAVDPGADTPTGPFTTRTTLIYNVVQTNIGNAYNPTTGIFTAPVAGFYYFSIFYHTDTHFAIHLELFKNNQAVVKTQDSAGVYEYDKADNGGNAVSLQLQRGDQVSVRMGANSRVWGHARLTTFNGFLVSQL